MAKESAVHRALGGSKSKGKKLHTHAVKYTRADNGGIHAEVERHTAEGHHHTEHHVLGSASDAADHLQEHMGDQPEMGAQQSAPTVPAPEAAGPEAAMGGGGDGGGGAPAPGPM